VEDSTTKQRISIKADWILSMFQFSYKHLILSDKSWVLIHLNQELNKNKTIANKETNLKKDNWNPAAGLFNMFRLNNIRKKASTINNQGRSQEGKTSCIWDRISQSASQIELIARKHHLAIRLVWIKAHFLWEKLKLNLHLLKSLMEWFKQVTKGVRNHRIAFIWLAIKW
jgi:hypothetical protein